MQHFFKKLEIDNTSINFYFNRIHTVEGDRFHISVYGKDKKAYSFLMKQEGEGWKLIHPDNCPDWIIKAEDQLSNIIIETIKI
jgi:hypothetical protein